LKGFIIRLLLDWRFFRDGRGAAAGKHAERRKKADQNIDTCQLLHQCSPFRNGLKSLPLKEATAAPSREYRDCYFGSGFEKTHADEFIFQNSKFRLEWRRRKAAARANSAVGA
jgi:hypothetical protein